METNGLITLQSCVNDVLNDIDSYSDSLIARYLRFAERGVSKLTLLTLKNVSTKTMPVNRRLNMASLPSDCVRLIRLGIDLNGKIYTLTQDSEIKLSDEYQCEATPSTSTNEIYSNYDGNYCDWNYQIRGGMSEYGTYRVNTSNNTVHFGQDVNLDEIVVEYVSSGLKQDGITYIPEMARETIIAWIKWKDLHKGNSTLGERQEAKFMYYEELDMLDAALMPSMDEIYDTLLSLNTPLIVR